MPKKPQNDSVQSARIAAELSAERAKLIEEFMEHLSVIDEQTRICVRLEYVHTANSSSNRPIHVRVRRSD